jgi:hypothetical protein
MWRSWLIVGIGASLLFGCSSTDEPAEPPARPPGCGHAHNDYEHTRPLVDALEQAFCSIEADIWLVGGELLVAHEENETDPSRTLQGLYLEPLRAEVEGGNLAYLDETPLLFLIDIKTEATATYAALHDVLSGYDDILTVYDGDEVTPGAVTAVISGERDRAAMEGQAKRFAAMDGRLEDLGTGASPALIPLISQSWFFEFLWLGDGDIPPDEAARLSELLEQGHAEQRRFRFWGTPDEQNVWQKLLDAGVDYINTDDLAGFSSFRADYP